LQELTQLIRIKLLIFRFLEIFGSRFQFPGGQVPILPPLRTPMALTTRGKGHSPFNHPWEVRAWKWIPFTLFSLFTGV